MAIRDAHQNMFMPTSETEILRSLAESLTCLIFSDGCRTVLTCVQSRNQQGEVVEMVPGTTAKYRRSPLTQWRWRWIRKSVFDNDASSYYRGVVAPRSVVKEPKSVVAVRM